MPSSPFLRRTVPAAIVVVVVVVALVPAALSILGEGDRADRLGGDFPSFYAAGRIVLDGDADALYDPSVQRSYQEGLHEDAGEFLYFAYPPFVAVAYAAIAWLPYGVALSVHALAAIASLVVACTILAGWLYPAAERMRRTVVATAVSLAVYPVLTAVLGGQNTTFTLLAVVVAWRAATVAPGVAGAAGAITLLKPQFGLIVVASLVAVRAWRAVAWAAGGAVAIYVVTASMWGFGWVGDWLAEVRRFGEVNEVVNGPLMVNVLGWVGNLSDTTAATLAATVVVAAGSVVTAVTLWRGRAAPATLGVMATWLVLGSLSALFYDAGVAIVAFGSFVVVGGAPAWSIPAVVGLSWTQPLAATLGWSPLFPLLVAMWAWQAMVLVRRPGFVSQATGTLADRAVESGSGGGEPPWQATGSS
jgi:hypothetical protein